MREGGIGMLKFGTGDCVWMLAMYASIFEEAY